MKKLTALALFVICLAAASCANREIKTGPFDPKATFDEANAKLNEKFYVDARELLEDIKRQDTEFEYAPLAQLRIADSYVMEEKFDVAVQEYGKFLEYYPRHKYASYAVYQSGMVYFNMIQGPDRGYGPAIKALDAFRKLQEQYPRNPYREEVELRIGRATEIIAEHEYMVGDFDFRNGAYEGAIGRLEPIRTQYAAYLNEPDVLYRLAVSYTATGRATDADEMMRLLQDKYPGSEQLLKARRAIAKLGPGEDRGR